MADRGSLFLDEIGDLPLDVQARLLRVLQSKEFERVGGGKETLKSDFRLIAATNRNLEKDVEAQKFRSDLYYRINVFPLHIPPLRDRKEDIPLLARYFLQLHSRGQSAATIPKHMMEKLVNYDWPGNVREMENIIQRGIIIGHEGSFVLPDFGGFAAETASARSSIPESLEENQKRLIMEALTHTGWRIYGPYGAARLLAIKPTSLCSRLKKLGIRRPSTASSK
jgi:transcriptional regulator with GAF, ATPase, and Fis domain